MTGLGNKKRSWMGKKKRCTWGGRRREDMYMATHTHRKMSTERKKTKKEWSGTDHEKE